MSKCYAFSGSLAPSQEELKTFAENEILPKIVDISFNINYYKNNDFSTPNLELIRNATLEFINSLGRKYYTADYDNIQQAFNILINDPDFILFKNLLPPGSIKQILKAKGTIEEINSKIFTDKIEYDEETEFDSVTYFIDNAYQQAILAKNELIRKMNKIVLNSFIINRENGTIISNIETANININNYKKELLQEIQNYLLTENSQSDFVTENITNQNVEDLIYKHRKLINNYLQVGLFSGNDLQDLYKQSKSQYASNEEKKSANLKLNAYGAWLALNHFDNFIKMTLGDTIIINSASKERYSYSSKGTNVNTTWRKNEDIDLTAEINKLVQSLITTSNMFTFGTDTPIQDAYLAFEDFTYISAKIKDLVYSSTAAKEFFDGDHNSDIYHYSLTQDEQRLVKNKSFRHIISSARFNPQKYNPIIYKILCSKNSNGSYFIQKFTNFNTQDQNIIWALFKNLYNNDLSSNYKSLYAIQKNNINSKNYYAAVSSVVDCIFSVNFVQYVHDNGVLKLRTLRDAAVDKSKKEISKLININNHQLLTNTKNWKNKYKIEPINSENGIFNGIIFKINDNISLKINNLGNDVTITYNNDYLSTVEYYKLYSENSVNEFIDEVLGINLQKNSSFRQTYEELIKTEGDFKNNYINTLLPFAGRVLMYRYFSQQFLSSGNKLTKLDTIKQYFADESKRPKFNDDTFTIDVINPTDQHVVDILAQALGATRGLNSSRQVRDGDNAMLSSQTLSRLLGGLIQQMETQINSYNLLNDLKTQLNQVKKNVPIIWTSPTIGKTFALTNYSDKIIDWDELFNRKRDQWIADNFKLNINSFEFKQKRTDILINWKNYENFQNFVKTEWNNAKNIAQQENKILVASPHMLLELFSEDFDSILTLSDNEFIKRGKLRGDEHPEEWKKGINETISQLSENDINFKNKIKIINDNEYLSDLLINGNLQNELNILEYNNFINKKLSDSEIKNLLNIEKDNNRLRILSLKQQINDLQNTSYLFDTTLNPAANKFEIVKNPNLFKGMLKSEEIKGLTGTKKQVKFTVAEAITSSFLHNFVLGFCDKSAIGKYSEFEDGVIGLLPSVNSDKTTVSIAKFDLNQNAPIYHKPYKDLKNDELLDVLMYQMNDYYTTMYNNIKFDFKKLCDYHKLDFQINPDDNFFTLNDVVDKHNINNPSNTITAEEYLQNLILQYNETHPTNPLRFIDQIHYVVDGKHIKFNNTIKSLLTRFSEKRNVENFFKLKNTEILKSILDSKFTLPLYGKSQLKEQPEITYLRSSEFSNWVDDLSGNMIIAKLNYKGKIYNISNSTDLRKFGESIGYPNIQSNIHELQNIITLHPMLEKYNLMDYMFTQQIMCSTVGSHVAHGKNKKLNIKKFTTEFKIKSEQKYITHDNKEIKIDIKTITTDRNSPVGARINHETGKIELDFEVLHQIFNEKKWSTPAQLIEKTKSGIVTGEFSKAQPLNENIFNDFDEFLTFVLEHEYAHTYIKRKEKDGNWIESKGDYETRINEQALYVIRQKDLLAEEAARYKGQDKRNVSFTAAMTQFQLNQIDGIPLWYNIAIIDDTKTGLFTVDGNTNTSKPYDGATFVNPIIMYLENNSLNEAKAGVHKKQFVHYYDELTGTGGIIKTAGFALTNDYMRQSELYRDMMYNMTNRIWKDYEGNDYIADITKNFKGEDVDYGTFYYMQNGNYYQATIKKANKDNTYYRISQQINSEGEILNNAITEEFTVNTNYQLWNLFGGLYSQEFVNGILTDSENSLRLVTKAVINTGKIKPTYISGDITAEDVDQPLKNADIHYMPTIGAVKQGAANINSNKKYHGKQSLNFFKIRMTNAGIQLDKEHHADDSELSLMTQVISLAASMGYNPKQQKKLYKAIYNLTEQSIKEFKEGLLEIFKIPDDVKYSSENGKQVSQKFETVIADCMIKNMITSNNRDGDLLKAIAKELINKARTGKELTFNDTQSFPYSDPIVFDKLVSNLSVIMTKAGIKAKMTGILSVLCPTYDIMKTYSYYENGIKHNVTLSQLEKKFKGDINQIAEIVQKTHPILNTTISDFDFTQLDIGTKYKITYNDGHSGIINLMYPHNISKVNGSELIMGYEKLKQLIKNGKVVAIQEYIRDGKDLNTINYKFKGINGKNYQVWDIDFMQDLFEIVLKEKEINDTNEKIKLYEDLITKHDHYQNYINAITNRLKTYTKTLNPENIFENISDNTRLKLVKQYCKQIQQEILFSLSTNNPTKNTPIKINNEYITIDKNSITVQPYEVIMPKIFLSEFGLSEYSNLDEIIHNEMYFYDQIINNFNTKIMNETLYDLELKRVNGDHIYIKDKAGIQSTWNEDLIKVEICTQTDKLGKLWRVDPITNKKLYQLFSSDDEVYKTRNGVEIILTSTNITKLPEGNHKVKSGITFYLNNFKYQSLHISETITAGRRGLNYPNLRPQIEDMLELIRDSKNNCAKNWIKLFINSDNSSWKENAVNINTDINNIDVLPESIKEHLINESKIIHTSLLKSLDIIAARIPAQNQQSFMPMKVVAWENPNVNTAYVGVMQFFLQGSDLDIDAVSLLTYSFDKTGKFYDWSPEFNFDNLKMLNLSMKLPFPTGKELKVIDYNDSDNYVNKIDRKPLITDNEDFLKLLNKNYTTKEEELQLLINLLEYVEEHDCEIYIASDENSSYSMDIINPLIERINNHNTYLLELNDKTLENAIKNHTVYALYSIATDAANWLEMHTGVDVATAPQKEIANKSELSEIQKTNTPGNVINKFQSIEEASVGKDDIAICATGLKAFFASTQFFNSTLNKFIHDNISEEEIASLTKLIQFNPVTIAGRTYKTLANIRTEKLEYLDVNSELYQTLIDRGMDEDASIIMSALLSLSTDNAKELCLAKINAGTNMMGLYLYGAAIGMDFETLNNIIASPLGFVIAKLMNSNEFTQTSGKISIDQALNYLYEGPKFNDVKKFDGFVKNENNKNVSSSVLNNFITWFNHVLIQNNKQIKATEKTIGKVIVELIKDGSVDTILNETRKYLNDDIFTKYKTYPDFKNYKSLCNQLIDYLEDFIEQANYIHHSKNPQIVEDFNKLVLGADEFKRLGQFLRLNQEIKTKSGELIDFVQKFENLISERITLINNVNKRINPNYKAINPQQNLDFSKFAQSFVKNENYHKEIIDIYETYCKTCVNPLRVLTEVDHYKGYFTSMIIAYEGDCFKSAKFRAIKNIGNKFIIANKVKSKSEKLLVYKGVKDLIDNYINNRYLQSKIIDLPKTIKIISNNKDISVSALKDVPIKLGTNGGNNTFVNFFETMFINNLKSDTRFKENIFIQDLTNVIINNPISGQKELAKSLLINMMPSSDNERNILNNYKDAFNMLNGQIIKINNKEYNIIEMFHYYNLIKFGGKVGKNNLTPIFEHVLTHDIFKEYRIFINNIDSKYDFNTESDKYENIQITDEDIKLYLSPLTSPFSSSSKFIKYLDKTLGEIVLLRKKEKDTGLPNNDYDYFNMSEFNDFDDFNDFEENSSHKYIPNYGYYNKYEGILKLHESKNWESEIIKDGVIKSYTINNNKYSDIKIKDQKIIEFTDSNGQKRTLETGISILFFDESKNLKIDEETLNNTLTTKICQ